MSTSVNLADISRFMVGSDTLKLTPFYLSTFTIPGITFAHPELPTRSGTHLKLGADSVDFGSLDLVVLLDSNFNSYFELLDLATKEINIEDNTFAMPEFDLWVLVLDADNKTKFRLDFKNCRISSIGEITLDPTSELGATVNVGVVFDYWVWSRTSVITKECAEKIDETHGIKTGETEEISVDTSTERFYEGKHSQLDRLRVL